MRTMIPLLAAVALTGCMHLPGDVKTTRSEFDGETQVQVAPGWLYAGGLRTSAIKLGGFWSDRDPDQFVLIAAVVGYDRIHRIGFRLDDETIGFEPAGGFTRYEEEIVTGGLQASRAFAVPLEFVERLVTVDEAIVRVETDGGAVEGRFHFDQQTYARPAFRKALQEIAAH